MHQLYRVDGFHPDERPKSRKPLCYNTANAKLVHQQLRQCFNYALLTAELVRFMGVVHAEFLLHVSAGFDELRCWYGEPTQTL